MPSEKELKHIKNVRIIILVVVTVGAFLAITLVSSTSETTPGVERSSDQDKRGDPGLLFEVDEREREASQKPTPNDAEPRNLSPLGLSLKEAFPSVLIFSIIENISIDRASFPVLTWP
ncbi:MAG: hypothetical protein LBE27_01475 [Deltaproteobacteria bacterium]|jgi:hypothetical protein|nr:hypothetical protein [Deltaproteobacteria bacterium]